MAVTERKIMFTNDLDGIHFYGPPPLKTIRQLVSRNLRIPEPNAPIGEYRPHPVAGKLSVLFHQMRPVRQDGLAGLELFRQAAEEHQRQLDFAALSGREKDKHEITEQALWRSGHMDYFSTLYLNQGKNSVSWKQHIVQTLTEQGLVVVHIDDDLRAGLATARVDEEYPDETRVLSYVLRNISNSPVLLERAHVEVPDNLVFIDSVSDAARDFSKRLKEKTL